MKPDIVKPPTRWQLYALRAMIIIGLGCMYFFMRSLLQWQVVGYKPLYWLLISTFVYTFFKIIYEWYHYWSISVPATPPVTRQYTVDIFTTFCAGEPYEMIEKTLIAVQSITYPHEAYLCDEADDPYLKTLCQQLGVHHVTRTVKIDAKAGNINNALRQSKGELCVVLDPDHVPLPEFLDPVVSHFDNPEIGYVQIVQAYYNQEDSWIAKGAAQQTYQFYGPMMMCMNSYGTAQAIGANCTFRRTALESIGGHAAGLAEDMHTAMQLHAKGWKSVYVPAVLTRGLVPATLCAYYKQQLKWSRGVFELLVTSYVKLFTKFSWRQKLHYGLIPMFYLSGFVFLINFILPVVSLFTGLYPLQMDFLQFSIIGIPFLTSVILIRHFVQQWVMEDNERGFHVVGGFLLIGTWWVFILGFIYTIIRKNVPYIPTPKDVKDEKNLKINLPNICVLAISILSIVYGLYHDWNPYTLFMAGVVSLNCFFMSFVLLASEELTLQSWRAKYPLLSNTLAVVKKIKELFWLLRRRIYSGVRVASFGLCVLVFSTCMLINKSWSEGSSELAFVYSGANKFSRLFVFGKKPFVDQLKVKKLHTVEHTPRAMKQVLLTESNPSALQNYTPISAQPVLNAGSKARLMPNCFLSVKGITYTKGNYWYKNIFPLNKETIISDFAEMKKAGTNTVKIYGPTVYDQSTIEAAEQQGLKIQYSFWAPDPSAFYSDAGYLNDLADNVMKTVMQYKANPVIASWHIANHTFQQLADYYHGAELQYARAAYIQWLKQLISQIKAQDPNRLLTIDVLADSTMQQTVNILHRQIPQIDAFGLIIDKPVSLQMITSNIDAPYFFSSVDPKVFITSRYPTGGTFYASWQDQDAGAGVTFNGLKDIWGRNKPYLAQISNAWHGNVAKNSLPYIKILRPAVTTDAGAQLGYNALVYNDSKWHLAAYKPTGITFEWYLVKTNDGGTPIAMQPIGNGPTVNVSVPAEAYRYRLYLLASRGQNVAEAYSILNIPLNN